MPRFPSGALHGDILPGCGTTIVSYTLETKSPSREKIRLGPAFKCILITFLGLQYCPEPVFCTVPDQVPTMIQSPQRFRDSQTSPVAAPLRDLRSTRTTSNSFGVFTFTNSASVWAAPAPNFPQRDFSGFEMLFRVADSRRTGRIVNTTAFMDTFPWDLPRHPNKCACGTVNCREESRHAAACPGQPTTKLWTFRWEFFCTKCRKITVVRLQCSWSMIGN